MILYLLFDTDRDCVAAAIPCKWYCDKWYYKLCVVFRVVEGTSCQMRDEIKVGTGEFDDRKKHGYNVIMNGVHNEKGVFLMI